MRRRAFIAAIASGAAYSIAAHGQQTLPLIAVLNAGSARSTRPYLQAWVEGMAALGYVDGRGVRIEYRFAEGDLARLPGLAAELVALRPAVIVSAPLPANLAVARLTKDIPIVMASGADPVGFGLVASLGYPGGNVTGVSNFAEELPGKQLEIARELLPALRRVGIVLNVGNRLHEAQALSSVAAAGPLGVELVRADVSGTDELDKAFSYLSRERVDATLVPPDTSFLAARERIAALAAKTGLPACYGFREHVEAGGLISYGVELAAIYRRAASYVDRIMRGAKPADLPVEQPTKFELVIHRRTAEALGLTIPPTLLARADEVIE
jgi:putative ABC transport system substrate-binding protein